MIATEIPGGAPIHIRWRGLAEYSAAQFEMQQFTAQRSASTPDEIWWLEHKPVYTLGISGDRSHIRRSTAIPVVASDRGGQVTYHGPHQLVVYPLLDLRRIGIGPRQLVLAMEQAVIDTVARWGIAAHARRDAPGVYAGNAKLASVGLRFLRRGCYHGLALNVANELAPFDDIDPCGFEGLRMTRLCDLGGPAHVTEVAPPLLQALIARLSELRSQPSDELRGKLSGNTPDANKEKLE